jgi:hypothetical protein
VVGETLALWAPLGDNAEALEAHAGKPAAARPFVRPGDGPGDGEPTQIEEISLSRWLEEHYSRTVPDKECASGSDFRNDPAPDDDLEVTPFPLSLVSDFGNELAGSLPAFRAQPFAGFFGVRGQPEQSGVDRLFPFSAPLANPRPTIASSPDGSLATFDDASVSSARFEFVRRRTVSPFIAAHMALTFPDGRVMDASLPPDDGPAPDSGSDGMVISQVYAAGGEVGSQYRQDYIEMFNRGTTAVDLSGWSIQYADAGSGTWQVAALSGVVAPGQYYLVWGWTGPDGTEDAPAADAVSGFNLGNSDGMVALLSTTAPLVWADPYDPFVVDFVGYGAADAFEGSSPAPATDPTLAALRDNGGLSDIDDNYYDFTAGAPAPRNSASPLANRPPVITVPGPQTTEQDTALTFSAVNGNVFSVSDPDAGSNPVAVWLSAGDGTLTLATTGGLTFTAGDGTADADMTFSGTITAINAALNGMNFTPTAGFTGAAIVSIVADDLGNSGAGGMQYDIDTVLVSVGGPLVAIDDSYATWEDTPTDLDVLANDAFLHSDSLSLLILTGPASGAVSVNGNGTAEPFITYTPNANFHGSDSFLYQVSDSQGHTSVAGVTLDVVSVNDAGIAVPPDQAAQEGEYVSLQINTPDNTGMALTFSAAGLPAGLSIDPTTGVISGRPLYSAAETNDGVYTVTVTAAAGGDSDTRSFTWYVNDTNRMYPFDD